MKERKLKVTYAPGAEYKEQIPRIVLQGKWLKELGFEVGEYVIISPSSEKIDVSKNKQ
ncbi:MAG: type I addiction module toxin, SymE family [Erysipelotrichia bacterium]|nr:type I addiction module toxin, SymE family [Erysipelotrichia bacterium]